MVRGMRKTEGSCELRGTVVSALEKAAAWPHSVCNPVGPSRTVKLGPLQLAGFH